MVQINLALEEEIVKGLFLGISGAAMKQIREKARGALQAKKQEGQIGTISYERSEGRQTYAGERLP